MKHVKTILCVLLGVMLVCSSIFAADQQKAQRKTLMIKKPVLMPTVKAELICYANKFMGKCPVTVMMDGKISSTGPATVYYHFKRSDNAVMRAVKLIFKGRETKTIPFRWKIGRDGTYSVQLIVKVGKKEIKSNIKGFMVDCEEQQKPKVEIKKLDPKLTKKLALIKAPTFKLEKLKRQIPKLIPVDLVTSSLKLLPNATIYHGGGKWFLFRLANHGIKTSPPCYVYVTLTSSRPSPKTGKRKFVHKYTLKPLPSGYGFNARVGYKPFWRGTWGVVVKVDGSNIIKEGMKESNNSKGATFIVK